MVPPTRNPCLMARCGGPCDRKGGNITVIYYMKRLVKSAYGHLEVCQETDAKIAYSFLIQNVSSQRLEIHLLKLRESIRNS